MAAVTILSTDRYTNLLEHHGNTLSAVNDWMEVAAQSSSYTFAASVTGGANFQLALECSFNGNGKTINSNGEYAYFYDGKPAARIRMRIASISSGTPSINPHIAVAYHG
jgi:hypothetical protein